MTLGVSQPHPENQGNLQGLNVLPSRVATPSRTWKLQRTPSRQAASPPSPGTATPPPPETVTCTARPQSSRAGQLPRVKILQAATPPSPGTATPPPPDTATCIARPKSSRDGQLPRVKMLPTAGEISSDLYRHQKTLRIIFLQTAMIPAVGLKLVGVNIYENIKGQPYFNSRNFGVFLIFKTHTYPYESSYTF